MHDHPEDVNSFESVPLNFTERLSRAGPAECSGRVAPGGVTAAIP